MNVLFVCLATDPESRTKPLQKPEDIRFGISYLSSLLKQRHYNTKLLVLGGDLEEGNKNIINEYIKTFCPELICFTAVTSEYHLVANIAKYIKSNYPDIYLLIGGIHTSLNPQDVISDDFDALCISEGFDATLELVSQLEKGKKPSGISNLWIKYGSEIEKNPTRPFLKDLDSLPFPDREMWLEWIAQPELRHSLLLGHGCPYQCTYCCNHALRRLAPGTYVRLRSPDNIVEEVKEVVDKYMIEKEIYLEVETLGVNKKWALELCSKIEDFNKTLDEPISFGANLRITRNTDIENLFSALKKANFRFIIIGLESGSEKLRREVLKRDYSNQDIINAVMLAKKHGLAVVMNSIIGIPGETIADFEETVKVNRICQPYQSNTYIFMPYPGTDLHNLSIQEGLLEGPLDIAQMDKTAVLDLPGFSRKQIEKRFIWFDYYVFRGHKPMYKIFARVLRAKIRMNDNLNHLYRLVTQWGLFRKLVSVLKKY